MFKWVSWALRMMATAVLLSFLCIWTTGYIVNSYMESIVKQLELPLETKPFALSGVWGTLWGVDTPVKEASEKGQEPNAIATNSDISSDDTDESGERAAETSAASDASDGQDQPSPSETTDITENGASLSPTTPDQGLQADTGDLQAGDAIPAVGGNAGGHITTDAERQALYANAVSKLDASQLQLLSEALEGELSADKLAQLKEMLKTALTEDEYEQMMETLQGTTNVD